MGDEEKKSKRLVRQESAFDKTLRTLYANHSTLEEISEQTGLEPADALAKIQDLIGKRDFLDESTRVQLILIDMEDLVKEAKRRAIEASDKNFSGIVNSARNSAVAMMGELRKIREEQQFTDRQIENSYSRKFVEIIDATYNRQLGRLMERYPEIDSAEMESEFRELLVQVSKEFDED